MTQATKFWTKMPLLAGAGLMLAAAPAFTQTTGQSGSTMGNDSTTGAGQTSAASPTGDTHGTASQPGMTANSSSMPSNNGHHANTLRSNHAQASASHGKMHASRTDTSQNSAVDQLNEQSYKAAQKGQNFMAGQTGSDSSGMTGTNEMQRGQTGASGGAMHNEGTSKSPHGGSKM